MKEFAYIHDEGTLPPSLEKVPFLESFSVEHLDDVLNSSSMVDCDPGDIVIQEGRPASRIYILLAGEATVEKAGERIATLKNVGDLFGELAAVEDSVRTASVVAKTKMICLAVDQKFLKEIKPAAENPEFYAALYHFIAKVTARRLKETSEELARVEKELEELKLNA